MRTILYHCDGCGRGVAGNKADPIFRPGARTFCKGCFENPSAVTSVTTVSPPKEDGRGAAAKARWDAMSPEAKKAKIEKMQAARAYRKADLT